jgi:hypothetical protein
MRNVISYSVVHLPSISIHLEKNMDGRCTAECEA